MSPAAVLVVDDEQVVRETVAQILGGKEFSVTTVRDGVEAVDLARQKEFEVAIVDLFMPEMSGMETVRRLKEISPDTEIIILTGHGSLESAIEAVREHVFEYLLKPVDVRTLTRVVSHAAERRRLVLQNRQLLRELEMERNGLREQVTAARLAIERRLSGSPSFLGESEAICRVRSFIAEVSPSDMTVLIRGESGTGKDVVARLIHEASGRDRTGAFVKINCPAIPESLLESELFGHEAGAFTGAKKRKPGRIELAANGTLFLDEIAEMPPGLQAKLLQFIEHKQFTRLGSGETIRVDTRIIAATNAPLEKMISDGRFRGDLFYRLNEYSILIPTLRDRIEDVPILARHFLRQQCEQVGREGLTLPNELLAKLLRYRWPGNVRELQTVMKRYAVTGREEVVINALEHPNLETSNLPAADKLHDVEVQTIMVALMKARWNQRRAAKMLGIGYSALRRRIAKYNLKDRVSA